MKEYLTDENGGKAFKSKSLKVKKLINEALEILESMGIPFNGISFRSLERMAVAFITVAQVDPNIGWSKAKDQRDGIALKSRDIIEYMNEKFGEKISSGSYDDIRRRDLKLLVLDGIIIRSNPNSARNDPTRGYCLSPEHSDVIKTYGSTSWTSKLNALMKNRITLKDSLSSKRHLDKVEVNLPDNNVLHFSPGQHNQLQKAIITSFLPYFGHGAEVLYVGDTADKFLFLNKEKLLELKFFELAHGELPDIVAYSKEKNWLFLIEAVHSSGPISPVRLMELENLTKNCKADRVYVTAFLDRETFRKFVEEIAWETEVWIAEDPEHLIHFNGDKFLGPYDQTKAK